MAASPLTQAASFANTSKRKAAQASVTLLARRAPPAVEEFVASPGAARILGVSSPNTVKN
jgi:hypothetical protein